MSKRQRIVGIIIAIIILSFSVVTWAFSSQKSEKREEVSAEMTYEQAMQAQKPFVVMFNAPWCGYCQRFEPVYKKLGEDYKSGYNFVTVNGEDPSNIGLVQEFAVGGYPTLYIVDPVIDNKICLSNTIYGDVRRLRQEFDRYLRIRAMINK